MNVDWSVAPDGIHVLHVDDSLDFADMAAEFVEGEDERITVRTAPTPEDGLALLAEHDIDCIVSDYDMPGTNGIEFLQTVRTGHPELPFILYTGKGSEEVASDAISAGVTDYLQKQTGADQYAVLANRITNAVEAQRSQRALEARNQDLQRYERMINSMLEAACIYDEEGHFETVNDYLADWYGKTPEELEGAASNLIPEIRAQYEGDPYREILEGDREFLKGQIEAEFPDHGDAVLEYLLTPLAVDGSIEGVVGVTRDVTERTIRERELQQTREEYQELFDGMNDMAWVIDVDGSVVTVNDAAVETLGYTRAELTSMSPHDIDEELDDETITHLIESMPEDGRQVFETVHRTKEGSDIPVEISSSLITYRGRTAILSIARDVSKRKERQQELQGVLDSMDDAVFLHRDDGSFSFVNRAAIERYGYDEDELRSLRPRDLNVPAEIPKIADRIQHINEDGQAVFETTHQTRSGETISVEINATSVTYRGESAILAIARDITERKKRERALERQNDQLEQFANVVSHDLRNPLNVATGRLELAESDCPSDHHEPIGDALDRMSVLIDDLLTLAQEGESIDQIRAVPLPEMVDNAWESVDTGTATLVDDTDREIVADESRLRQLLENLFRNAVEHGSTSHHSQAREDGVEHGSTSPHSQAREDGVELCGENVTVTVGDLADGFYVADDGVGIPPDDHEEIFEISYTTSDSGTGLGLSIVKQVADAHGWDLRVTESAEGGARFEITGVESPAP